MPTESISFRDTTYFSEFICDYLDQKPELRSLYNRFPTLENFKSQIEEKGHTFNHNGRAVLVRSS